MIEQNLQQYLQRKYPQENARCECTKDEQKIRKVGNLLSAMKKDKVIQLSDGKRWTLVEV